MRTADRTLAPLHVILASLGLCLLAACAGPDAGPSRPNATHFEGATIVVGDGSTIENGVFIVEDGRFTEVGAVGEVPMPPGATHVDLTGRTVIPALVNTHVHLGVAHQELTDQLQQYAYYGVGTVQSMGLDTGAMVMEMRGESVPGGARYLNAGRGITAPEPGRTEAPHWVTSDEEARAAVRELAGQSVELVKIWVDDRNGEYDKLAPELYGAVIDEAHANGQIVAAHIFALEDAKGLLRAGVDAFAHSVRDIDIDEEGLALFRENPNVVLIPNLPASDGEAFAVQARNLTLLNGAGTRIAMGTDGGSPPAAHQEMADMVTAGMSPAEVIVAATSTGAAFLGLDDVGTIGAGNVADFVVLEASPLDDIVNTTRIVSVYLRGAEVDRAAIEARMAAAEAAEAAAPAGAP
jgi:imidazolonepropionase-like amidohydrolase